MKGTVSSRDLNRAEHGPRPGPDRYPALKLLTKRPLLSNSPEHLRPSILTLTSRRTEWMKRGTGYLKKFAFFRESPEIDWPSTGGISACFSSRLTTNTYKFSKEESHV